MKNIFTDSIDLIVKTLEGISSSTDKMATSAKAKSKEILLSNKKRELLNEVANQSYELWIEGRKFPIEIDKKLSEIAKIDEEINIIKTKYYSYIDPNLEKEIDSNKETRVDENNSQDIAESKNDDDNVNKEDL